MATHHNNSGRGERDGQGTGISARDRIAQNTADPEEKDPALFEKEDITAVESRPDEESGRIEDYDSENYDKPAETANDLITEVIHVEDDPSLNPWTFRVAFLGIGLSTFGGSLATIYYFKVCSSSSQQSSLLMILFSLSPKRHSFLKCSSL
jgi:hypothetical protein